MNREQREQTWIDLGLLGSLEMMDASCSLAERLEEKHMSDEQAYTALMGDIAHDIIAKRQAMEDNSISMEEYNSLPLYRG